MTSADTTANEHRCLLPGCNRKLTDPKSVSRGYGPRCWAKIRAAVNAVDLSAWTASQVEDARLAIEDGAVVPSTREGVFHVVNGTEVYRTHRNGCTCTNGLKTLPPRPCWHRAAVVIMLATHTAAPSPAAVRVPVALPAPATPADDVWAALEAMGALDPVPAF